MKRLLSVVCAVAILLTTASLMLQPSLSADNINLVENGDFSTEDLSYWTDENSSRKTTILKSGNNAINGATAMVKSKNGAISQIISIDSNSEYSFGVTVKTLGSADADLSVTVLAGEDYSTVLDSVSQLTATGNSTSVRLSGRFSSAENTSVKIRICNANTGSQAAAVDDVKLEKIVFTVNDELLNGDFESDSMAYWRHETEGLLLNEVAENAIGGSRNVLSPNGKAGCVSQMFKIDANTDYNYSISVKSDSDKTLEISILGGADYSELLANATFNQKTGILSADKPAVVSGGFASGESTSVKVVISVSEGTNGSLYFDDVVVGKVNTEIINGDFESGDLTGWKHNEGAEIITENHNYKSWSINGKTLYLDNENGMVWQTMKVEKGTYYYYKATGITCSFNQMELSMKIYAGTVIDEQKLLASASEGGKEGTWKNRYASFAGEFNTGDNDRITVVFSYNAFDNFACVDDVVVAKDTIVANDELLNGNFDDGNVDNWIWTGDPAKLTIEDEDTLSYSNPQFPLSVLGIFSPKLYADKAPTPQNHFFQVIKAKPLTTYEYSFYVWSGWASVYVNIYDGKYSTNKLCETMIINDGKTWGHWHHFSGTVTTSADAQYIRFDFGARADGSNNFYYMDDIVLRERPSSPEKIINGDFEFNHFVDKNGYGGWYTESDKLEFVDKIASNSGRFSLFFGEDGEIYQTIRVYPDIDYEVSLYHRGTYGEVDIKLFDEQNNLLYENKSIHTNASRFEKMVGNIRFDSEQTVKVVITASKGSYIDDAVVSDPKDIKPIISQSTPKILVFNSSLLEIQKEAENLFVNGDFESEPEKGKGWNTDEFIGQDFVSVAKNTSKALKFSSKGEDAKTATIWIDVEPETEYTLSMELLGEYLSVENSGLFNISIINPATNRPLSTKDARIEGICPTSYDNKWHRRAVVFTTGYCTQIGLQFCGTNTTVWIDNAILCSSDYAGRKAVSADTLTIKEQSNATVTCVDSENIISSVNWSDGVNYGKVAVYNKGVFYYNESTTPQYISYLKYFNVKPNTDYVAAFKIRAAGDGYASAGIASKTDKLVRFFDVKPEYSDNQWESYTVTFNTGNVSELAFAVTDGGGSLEVDDLVICNASAAVFGAPLERVEDESEDDFEDDEYLEEDLEEDDEPEEETKKKTKKKLTKKYNTIIVTDYTWIVILAVVAGVVLVAGTIIVIIIIKKKKGKGNKETEEEPDENA